MRRAFVTAAFGLAVQLAWTMPAVAQLELTASGQRVALPNDYQPCDGVLPPGVRFDAGAIVLTEPLVETRRIRLPLRRERTSCSLRVVTLRPEARARLTAAPGPNAVELVIESPAISGAATPSGPGPRVGGQEALFESCSEGRCSYRFALPLGVNPASASVDLDDRMLGLGLVAADVNLPAAPPESQTPVIRFAAPQADSRQITGLPPGYSVCGGTSLPIEIEVRGGPELSSLTRMLQRENAPEGENGCREVRLEVYGPAAHSRLAPANISAEQTADPNVVQLHVEGIHELSRQQLVFDSLDMAAAGRWSPTCLGTTCTYELRFSTPPSRLVSLSLWAYLRGTASASPVHALDGTPLPHSSGYPLQVQRWRLPTLDLRVPIVTQDGPEREIPLPSHPAFRFIPQDSEVEIRCGTQVCGRAVRRSSEPALVLILTSQNHLTQLAQAPGSLAITMPAAGAGGTNPVLRVQLRNEPCSYDIVSAHAIIDGHRSADAWFWVFGSARECLHVPLRVVSTNDAMVLGDTGWDASLPALETAVSWPAQSARGAFVRPLHVSVASVTGLGGQRVTVRPRFVIADAPLRSATGQPAEAPLFVREALELDPALVDVELADDRFLGEQRVLIADHANFLRVLVPPDLRRTVRLRVRDRLHEPCAGAESGRWVEAAPRARLAADELPWSSDASGVMRYCVQTRGPADSLRLRVEVSGPLAALGAGSGVLAGGAALENINLGYRDVEVALPTRELHQPWNLAGDARLSCVDGQVQVEHQMLPRPLLRDQYRYCRIEMRLPRGTTCAADRPGQVFAAMGRQHIRIEAQSGELRWRVRDLVLSAASVAASNGVECVDGDRIAINLNDVLADAPPDLSDYAPVTFEVRHPPREQRDGGLSSAHIPAGWAANLESVAQLRTRLRPRNGITGWSRYDASRYGVRISAGVTGNFTFFRSPSSGINSATSSSHDTVEEVTFDYGLLAVFEPWDFSRNDSILPFLNPQLHVGVLLPKTFDRETVFHSMSLVVGLGLRLPASSTPSGGASAQTALIGWYELSAGERSAHHAFLLGVNMTVAISGD